MPPRTASLSLSCLAVLAALAVTASAQGIPRDSRGLPLGTDPSGNAINGINAPRVPGTATSPWNQSTNGGTQQVPAPVPPPVTYGGPTAAPGAPAQQLYPAGTIKRRRDLPPQYWGGGVAPAQHKLADCIASWDEDSGVSKKQWTSNCRRDYVRAAEDNGKAKRKR